MKSKGEKQKRKLTLGLELLFQSQGSFHDSPMSEALDSRSIIGIPNLHEVHHIVRENGRRGRGE